MKVKKYINISVVFAIILCVVGLFAFTNVANGGEYFPSKTIQAQLDEINNQLNESKANVDKWSTEIEQVKNEKVSTNDEINNAKEELDEKSKEIEEIKPQLEKALRNNYSAYYAKEVLDDVCGSTIVSDFLFNWDIICFFTDSEDAKALKEISEYTSIKNNYEYLCDKGKNTEEKIEKLQKDIANTNANIANLSGQQQAKQAELQEMLEVEKKFGQAAEAWIYGNGYFAHPCPKGVITSRFGEAREGDTSGGVHKGTDFAAPMGTEIYAAADGTVIDATYTDDYNHGSGMMIVLQHKDGLVTKYFHCSHVYIPIGMTVTKGQNIALVGSTGDSTGPHCHFQVELNGTAVDCAPYLNL